MLEELITSGSVLTQLFVDSRDFKTWLENNRPDLIISDISMPHMSGPELGHCIRAMQNVSTQSNSKKSVTTATSQNQLIPLIF